MRSKNLDNLSEIEIKEKILFQKIDLFFRLMNENLKKYTQAETMRVLNLRS